MRFFGTLVLILLVEFSRFSIADQQNYRVVISSAFREKCERNGGPEACENYNYTASAENFSNCLGDLVNLSEFEGELSAAVGKPDELEQVYQKYRLRVSPFENCLNRSIKLIDSCLDPAERRSIQILYDVTKTMLKIFSENGNAVASFLNNGGRQCLRSKYPLVQRCADRSFANWGSDFFRLTIPGLGILPHLSLDHSGCIELRSYSTCGVEVLRGCENPVPAQLVENLFNSVLNKINCSSLIYTVTIVDEVN